MTTEKQIIRKEHHKGDEGAGEDEEVRSCSAAHRRSLCLALTHCPPTLRLFTRSTSPRTATTCSALRCACRWQRAAAPRLIIPPQGIARALNVFRGVQPAPTYTLTEPASGVRQRMVRRVVRCAKTHAP